MKSPKDKERYRQWRIDNPDKIAAQRARRAARRRGELAPWVKPPPPTPEQSRAREIERQKRNYQKRIKRLASDPEYAAAYRAYHRARAAKRYAKTIGDPAAHAEKLEKERIRRAEKRKLNAERAAIQKPQRAKMTPEERRKRRQAQQKEYDRIRRGKLRAARASEVAAAIANQPPPPPPVVCPDPPELQALFKKASKGLPPMERYTGKKLGAFTARAKWI